MKKLAIAGKVIDVSKILEKSQAQFAAQLRQNGITDLPEEALASLYERMQKIVKNELEQEQKEKEEQK